MTNSEKDKLQQKLAQLSKEEVYKLFKAKINACKTVAQEVEMYNTDEEYLIIKKRLLEL